MKNQTNRSGLILLIVLGMLALFSLLAVTYVVFASQTRTTSISHTKRFVRETPTRPLLDEAVKQLIRGTKNPNSSLMYHDLLGDLNGVNETKMLATVGIKVRIPSNDNEKPLILSHRYLRIPISSFNNIIPGQPQIDPTLPSQDDVLNGRIVTFKAGHGPLGGQSFHIVRYIGDGTEGQSSRPNGPDSLIGSSSTYSITIDLQEADLTRTQSVLGLGVSSSDDLANSLCYFFKAPNTIIGYELFLNAVPLNGHGLGVQNDGTSLMDDLLSGGLTYSIDEKFRNVPVALQPRLHDSSPGQDTDEPIDAADYNTMFLSHRFADDGRIIPSFHRAALINYLAKLKPYDNQFTEMDFWAMLKRIELASLRPLSISIRSTNPIPTFMGVPPGTLEYQTHPRFVSRGIPTLRMVIPNPWNSSILTTDDPRNLEDFPSWIAALTNTTPTSPWDIDNDLDGVADSILMDIGLPLQRTADGKLLKALVSYYVEDLDGKLDINATGGTAQAGLYASDPFTQPNRLADSTSGRYGQSSTQPLGQGMGYGPADISFQHLFPNNPIAYQNFMMQRYSRRNPLDMAKVPGGSGWDAISQLHHLREQRQFDLHGALPGLPMGVRGRASVALDRLGNPFFHHVSIDPSVPLIDRITLFNNEYEARLISGAYQNSPFEVAEWERIYRAMDGDWITLPRRLQDSFLYDDVSLVDSNLKHEITPRSRHLRTPKLAARSDSVAPSPASFYDLVNTVLKYKQQALTSHAPIDVAVFRELFPLEFHRSAPMNANRPFGNGFDDNGNGEIDEPLEMVTSQQTAPFADTPSSIADSGYSLDALQGNFGFDYVDLTSLPAANPLRVFQGNESRQLYARHIYCLAQLLVPVEYQFPNLDKTYWEAILQGVRAGNLNDMNQFTAIRSRILAQWAVNVVDFRDSDAVLTRFPYDPDPLNILNRSNWNWGWRPNRDAAGVVPATVNVAWGMEQPELLLTESLAFHDARIRDGDPSPMRERFDQFRTPQGSLFLELYAPRTTATDGMTTVPGVPNSLYGRNGDRVGLNISRLTPGVIAGFGNQTQYPVWRVYVGNPVDKTDGDPDDPKTPNERLTLPGPATTATRFDLTLQLPKSNLLASDTNAQNGLVFDYAATNTLDEPNPAQSRVIIFTPNFTPTVNNTPGVTNPEAQVFYNRSGNLLLEGNQYLVIGPRETTFLGSRLEARSTLPTNKPNRHRIQLGAGWPEMFRPTAAEPANRDLTNIVRPAVTMIAAANLPQGGLWESPPTGQPPANEVISQIGISVSEPLPLNDTSYYKRPTHRVNTSDNGTDNESGGTRGFGVTSVLADGYHDYGTGAPVASADTAPFDTKTGTPLKLWWDKNFSYDDNGDREQLRIVEVGTDTRRDAIQPGTAIDWCTAYLQRLADPDKPWHKDFNPYITVDWIPIDLTVFNGEEDHEDLDPIHDLRLASRQKSGQLMRVDVANHSLDYEHSPANAMLGQSFLSSLTYAPRVASSTTALTFLKFEIPGDTPSSNRPTRLGPENDDGERKFFSANTGFTTLGFLNSTFVLAAESNLNPPLVLDQPFVGAPGNPEPTNPNPREWHPSNLFWANRPYVNSFELAYVPVSSPGQIGQEFTANALANNSSPYVAANNNNPMVPASIIAQYPFGHLLNFFQEMPAVDPTTPEVKDLSLAQLFDWIDTPSPWADVEAVQPPSAFQVSGNELVANATNAILRPYRAPYNTLARDVEPGRVNLNTISEPNVLKGLLSHTIDTTIPGNENERWTSVDSTNIAWEAFTSSRQGFKPIDGGHLNRHYPTEFAGLFKPVSEAGMVPTTRLPSELPDGSPITDADLTAQFNALQSVGLLDKDARWNPVHSTLLRPQPQFDLPTGDAAALGIVPPNLTQIPFFAAMANPSPTDLPKHPFVDLYPISRLQKLVTDKSNVFAVYVTVALFETEYDAQSNLHIGREYGLDNGQNKRYRAFYLIDRSIPVGYRVGEDHNTENTILVRRTLSE